MTLEGCQSLCGPVVKGLVSVLHGLLPRIAATGSSTSVTLSAEVIEHERVELCVFFAAKLHFAENVLGKDEIFPVLSSNQSDSDVNASAVSEEWAHCA